MIDVGFFQELEYESKSISIKDAFPDEDNCEAPQLAEFLDSGETLVATAQSVDDVFDNEKTEVGVKGILTDGTYVWPAELGYYVRQYGIELPAEFCDHARSNNFQAVQLSHDELVACATRYRETRFGGSN